MPRAEKKRQKSTNHLSHTYAATTTLLSEPRTVPDSAPKKKLNLNSLTECFKEGLLDLAQPITEQQLLDIGNWRTLKKGGLKLCGEGAKDFHHVINITLKDASAVAIMRIRELGGSVHTAGNPWNDSADNNKFMRLSKGQREDTALVKKTQADILSRWSGPGDES
ncbi:hypothetical protein MMC13_000954 [Lambiella insularis]|nr:hypothetical protein [Lambiella insularis]